MRVRRRAASLFAGLCLAGCGAVGALAAHGEVQIPVPQVTPKGVGGVKIGATLQELQGKGLVGGARKGCELSPGERVAPLRAPLKGFAVFYPKNRVISVSVTGGPAKTAARIGIGAPVGEARQAYPGAVYDAPPPRAPIQVGFIWIGGRMHPKMTLVIDPDTHRVSEISVPFPNICE
jgi:hypothetical protein